MNRYSTTKVTLLACVLLALELTLLDLFSVKGARPEPLLTLACFAALFARDSRQGLMASWIIGLVKDLSSAGPWGLHALLFLATGAVVLQIRQVLYREFAVTQLVVSFVAAWWVNVAAAIFVSVTVGGIPFGVILGRSFLSATLTAVSTPVLLYFIRRMKWLVR